MKSRNVSWHNLTLDTIAAKCAQRALADTLRQEVQMHSGGISKYSIHCAFPANFWSETFIEEQKSKPQLTKVIESTDRPIEDLQRKLLSAEKIAEHIVEAVMKGDDFIICTDFISSVLFSGMTGPSPKRGWGIVDGMFGVLSNLLVWPMLRRHWRHLSSQAKSTAELKT
jgi:3-dehydrosphinganine reductase